MPDTNPVGVVVCFGADSVCCAHVACFGAGPFPSGLFSILVFGAAGLLDQLLDEAALSTTWTLNLIFLGSEETFINCSNKGSFNHTSCSLRILTENERHTEHLLGFWDSPKQMRHLLCPYFRGISPLQDGQGLKLEGSSPPCENPCTEVQTVNSQYR